MSSDLEIYKKNRINENNNNFNNAVMRLYLNVNANIKNITYSRQSNAIKQTKINNLINQYYSTVNILKNNLDKSNLSIKLYKPNNINITKNKNALLIGINYTGTSSELFGCINDVNSIKEKLITNNFNNINVLTDSTEIKATKYNVLSEFKKLLINSQEGDLLFFMFSGHGSYTYDTNGD